MAQKLNFNPNPVFPLTVVVPVPGGGEAALNVVFRHKTPQQLEEIATAASKALLSEKATAETSQQAMADALLSVLESWEWDQELNAENLIATVNNYPSFYRSVIDQYGKELWNVRQKN